MIEPVFQIVGLCPVEGAKKVTLFMDREIELLAPCGPTTNDPERVVLPTSTGGGGGGGRGGGGGVSTTGGGASLLNALERYSEKGCGV